MQKEKRSVGFDKLGNPVKVGDVCLGIDLYTNELEYCVCKKVNPVKSEFVIYDEPNGRCHGKLLSDNMVIKLNADQIEVAKLVCKIKPPKGG